MNTSTAHILTDSRSLTRPADTLFIALETPSGNGHDYIRALYDKGVRNFMVSRAIDGEDEMKRGGATFIHTGNTLDGLQQLGREAREKMKGEIIAVTGSRGKTIVKEWLWQMLGGGASRSPRSFNSQVGVPLAVIQTAADSAYGIFEAGVSVPGEMQRLESILLPHIAVITNVTAEHDEGFTSREEKIAEKLIIARQARSIVYCNDDQEISNAVMRLKAGTNPTLKEITWSRKGNSADVTVNSITRGDMSTTVDLSIGNDRRTITTLLSSETDIDNLVTALAALYAIKGEHIHELHWDKLATCPEHINTRLTVLEGINNCKVIVDRFTRDALSLRPAIDFARRAARSGQPVTAILPCDAIQDHKTGYTDINATIAVLEEYGVKRLILTGCHDEVTTIPGMAVEKFATFADFMSSIGEMHFVDETIYVNSTGITPDATAQLLGKLEARQHETVLEVNLDAIVRNYNYFRSHLNPSTGLICMLKADAYGAGATEIAHTLEQHGVEAIAVAVADEGHQLREHGIKSRIIVLNPRSHDLEGMVRMDLEPVVYDLAFLGEIAAAAATVRRKASVHIKLETGMRRLGFIEEDMPRLIEKIKEIPDGLVEIKSAFSHLATADCLDMDDYSHEQIDRFTKMCATLKAGLPNTSFKRHILNTPGILRFPEAQMECARLGIGLYGIPTLPAEIEDGLSNVSSLYTTVISVKHWPAGTTVGYGRRGVLHRDSIIATLPIGYADGIDRHFGNGAASMMVRGVMCPTVGNICMDLCMIDVTDCPACSPGDRVEIFGPNVPVEKLADTLGTIPYEILTSVSRRVKRVYFRE